MKKIRTALLCALVTMSASAFAADGDFKVVLQMGITGGGDKLATVTFTDGTKESITAGGTFQFGLGAEWQPADLPVSVRATINHHFDSVNASNGDLKFKRSPIELVADYHVDDKIFVGGGLRLVNGVKYTQNVPGNSGSVDFDNTTGLLAGAGYKFNKHFQVSLRYVSEEYTTTKTGQKFDGSHAGLFTAFLF